MGVDAEHDPAYNGNRCSHKCEQKQRKGEKMAFHCVLFLKEECDGCGRCSEEERAGE